jgi:hypothetical protein
VSDPSPTGGPPSDQGSRSSARLKILVVSFRFPPFNSAGAVYVGKTVKYLVAVGHEIRVVTARDQQLPTTLPMGVDPHVVISTGWFNPMSVAEPAAGGRERIAASGFSAGRKHDRLVHRVGRFYRSIMIPDKEIGWGVPAYRAGWRVTREWRPDVIYASAPPYTSLLVAKALSRRSGIPWVAGMGDLWSDNPYRSIRLARFDRALESRVLNSAAAVVVTTDESAELMRGRYRKPTVTVMSGYDSDDVRERTRESNPEVLQIVHTGVLYHDRRDPTALFHAMQALRKEGRTVVADFYGRDSVLVARAAERVGVEDLVSARGPVAYGDSLQAQRNADLLLILQWNNIADRGICPAKIFEYAAARRPVLSIGPDDGVVARLLSTFGMGIVLQRPDDIAGELRRLLDIKAEVGRVPDVAPRPPDELACERQVEKLSHLLTGVVQSRGFP